MLTEHHTKKLTYSFCFPVSQSVANGCQLSVVVCCSLSYSSLDAADFHLALFYFIGLSLVFRCDGSNNDKVSVLQQERSFFTSYHDQGVSQGIDKMERS